MHVIERSVGGVVKRITTLFYTPSPTGLPLPGGE